LRSLLDGALAGAAAGAVRSGAAGLSEAFAGELPPVIGEAYSPASVERRTRPRRTESLRALRHLRVIDPELEVPPDAKRPRTRGECVDGPRPCPWVSCRHSLYLEVNAKGGLRYVYPEREVEDMPAEFSCSLDVADRGGVSRVELAGLLRLTPERTRQLVDSSIGKLRGAKGIEGLAAEFGVGGEGPGDLGDGAERREPPVAVNSSDPWQNGVPALSSAGVAVPPRLPPAGPSNLTAKQEPLTGSDSPAVPGAAVAKTEPIAEPSPAEGASNLGEKLDTSAPLATGILGVGRDQEEKSDMGASNGLNGAALHAAAGDVEDEPTVAELAATIANAKARLREKVEALRAELEEAEAALGEPSPGARADASPRGADDAEPSPEASLRRKPGRPPSDGPRRARIVAYVASHAGQTTGAIARALNEDARRVAVELHQLKRSAALVASGPKSAQTWSAP